MEQAAVDFDVVALQVGFGAKFGDNGAVARHPALHYDLFRLPAGCDAGLRQDLLEALFRHYGSLSGSGGAGSGCAWGGGGASSLNAIRRISSNSLSDGSSLKSFKPN